MQGEFLQKTVEAYGRFVSNIKRDSYYQRVYDAEGVKPKLPKKSPWLTNLSLWPSIGSGSTIEPNDPWFKEFCLGVRDPTLGDQSYRSAAAAENDEEDSNKRPYFFRSFYPISECGIFDSQFKAVRSGVSFYMAKAFSSVNWKYRSELLDLNDKQNYENLAVSLHDTKEKIRLFYTRSPASYLQIAALGHLLLQHRVLILYEYDEVQRKVNAKRSFSEDIVGKWNFPKGDLLLILRPPPKSCSYMVMCIEEATKVWNDTAVMLGSYGDKMVARCTLDKNFQIKYISDGLNCNSTLKLTLHFKPVFFPVYFELESGSEFSPKKVMALKILEKICLATEHLCDSALVGRQIGSAFSLSQRAKFCCVILDHLLGSPLLSKHQCYTHLMANWLLGNSAFYFFFHMKIDHVYVTRQYEAISSAFHIFSDLEYFCKTYLGHSFWRTKTKDMLSQPAAVEESLEIGLRAFRELKPPGRWTRSHFRAYAMTALRDLYLLKRWTENLSLTGCLKVPSLGSEEAEAQIPSDCLLAPLRDMAVLARLVAARAHRYRATVWDALAMFTHGRMPRGAHQSGPEPFIPHSIRAPSAAWNEMQESLGSASRILQCAAAAGGKFWLRVFLRVVVERSCSVLARVQNSVNFLMIENPAVEVVQIVHSLCTIASLCSKVNTMVKTTNARDTEEMKSTFTAVVGLHCSALSSVYLYWHRTTTETASAEENQRLLRIARYYHSIAALGFSDRTVALAYFNHYITEMELTNTVYEEGQEDLPYSNEVRRRLLILQRCVEILPFLWEYSITTSTYGPKNYKKVMLPGKTLPISPDKIEETFSESCKEGREFVLRTFQRLPNFLMPDCPADGTELHKSFLLDSIKSHINIISGVGDLRDLSDDSLDTIMKAVGNIILCLYHEPKDSMLARCREIAYNAGTLMVKLSLSTVQNGLRYVDFAIQNSTIKLTLSLLSVIFAVVGTESSWEISDRLYIELSSKFRNALTFYIINLKLKFRDGSQRDDEEPEYVYTYSDITSFFLSVPEASKVLGFDKVLDSCSLPLQLHKCIQNVISHIAAVGGERNDPNYLLLSCEIVKLTSVLERIINKSVTSGQKKELNSFIAKCLFLNLIGMVPIETDGETWCATAFDVCNMPDVIDALKQKELWLNPELDVESLFPVKLDRFSSAEVPGAPELDIPPIYDEDILSNIGGPSTKKDEFVDVESKSEQEQSVQMSSSSGSSTLVHDQNDPSAATAACSSKPSSTPQKATEPKTFLASDREDKTTKKSKSPEKLKITPEKSFKKLCQKMKKIAMKQEDPKAKSEDSKNVEESDPDAQEIFLPGVEAPLHYNPFKNLDQYIEEEEKGCLRIEMFALTSQFIEATGDFKLRAPSPSVAKALEKVKRILLRVISGLAVCIIEEGDGDITFTEFNGGNIVVSSDQLNLFSKIRKFLLINFEICPAFAVTQALSSIDKGIFNGSMLPLLRGAIDATLELATSGSPVPEISIPRIRAALPGVLVVEHEF